MVRLNDHLDMAMTDLSKNEKCVDCKKLFEKQQKKIECGFCEMFYCNICSGLNRNAFDALSTCVNASWYCTHCAHAVPGVQKLLVRVGNVEQKYEKLNTRVESLENRDSSSSENVKELILEEMTELKEIEGRRLNIICLNLPESKQLESADRQLEDREFLTNMFDSKMNLNVHAIQVNKLIRLGRRVINKDGIIKPRPLRFTVDIFDHKRQILKANSLLRDSDDLIFNNIYFTPDLTKIQRQKAYDLRVERRQRELAGERNLKISRGKIVVATDGRGTAESSSPSANI